MILSDQSLPSALCYQKKYTSPLTHTTEEITIALTGEIPNILLLSTVAAATYKTYSKSRKNTAQRNKVYPYSNNYKSRLLELRTLPLMYWLEIQDIMLLIRNLKDTSDANDLHKYIKFANNRTIKSKWYQTRAQIREANNYAKLLFIHIVRLWNALPRGVLDLELSLNTNKTHLTKYLWKHFIENFDPNNLCTFHFLCPCYKCIANTRTYHV